MRFKRELFLKPCLKTQDVTMHSCVLFMGSQTERPEFAFQLSFEARTIHNAAVCRANFLFGLLSFLFWATLLTMGDDGAVLSVSSKPIMSSELGEPSPCDGQIAAFQSYKSKLA